MSDRSDAYTLADLARLADVTPRTVRYYLAAGLLPAADAAGASTRYGEGHLARLRLIRRLQRDHLPLAEIRGRLERMPDDEVGQALAALASPTSEAASPDSALAFVRQLMTRAGVAPGLAEQAAPAPAPAPASAPAPSMPSLFARRDAFERRTPDEFPIREAPGEAPQPGPATPRAPAPGVPFLPSPPRVSPGDRSTWERLSITPDVELHVRRPLDRQANRRVEQLIRIARDLFADDDL